jgi:hypothetical protein
MKVLVSYRRLYHFGDFYYPEVAGGSAAMELGCFRVIYGELERMIKP